MSNNFIKLDRKLIRVLGLNKAVVFCHLLGIQDSINNKRDKQDAIYQQQDRLIYDTGLSKATLIKVIKELETKDKLLHTIKGTEGNKTKYLVDGYNYKKLLEIIDTIETNSIKKNKINATSIKRDVLNLYYEWCNNNTTSSDNFNTTNKDLIEKKNKLKNIKSTTRQLLSNCKHKPITINYYNSYVYDESITYQFIPLLFKDEYSDKDITDILYNRDKVSNYINKNELDTLEYFLKRYYQYYGYMHKPTTAVKVREILQKIYQVLSKDIYSDILDEIIDEYFNTPNTKNRDLTIHLFLSNDNGYYSWINKIAIRLNYISEDIDY
jgi:hypothetical protein